MADYTTQPNKRQREEEEETQQKEETNITKRQKSYNDILSILEDEEVTVEPDPEIGLGSGSDILATLQQELGFLPTDEFESDPINIGSGQTGSDVFCSSSAASSSKEDELEDDRSSVIRHLLEASDDELGIPSGDGINGGDFQLDEVNGINGGDFPFAVSDGLWEFEDEAANYYSLLQSELFM